MCHVCWDFLLGQFLGVNYLFHAKSARNYSFKKYSSPLPGDLMVALLGRVAQGNSSEPKPYSSKSSLISRGYLTKDDNKRWFFHSSIIDVSQSVSDTCALPATESETRPCWPLRQVADYKRLPAKTNSNGMDEREATLSLVRAERKCKLVSHLFCPAQNQLIRIRSRRRYWPVCRRHITPGLRDDVYLKTMLVVMVTGRNR